ncbi:sodium:solute symporter [Hyphomicrobium sp. NDB2Meth4]|uniref:solute symporter family protein n=1 Tax=Hyphomicrobium sp. NDB2Meth4 TaxID=1892846 RepID=UPI000931E802|nr:sodium:solute symporter [Hyphomicrobium sp. NDB2Meth4]
MSVTSRTRFVNPRLGTYFGIFVSSLFGLLMLLLIFEELGTSDSLLRWAMLLGPIILYAAIGLSAPTREPIEFFAAGRRVPAGYTGLGIGVATMGATGIVAITGVFFLIGYDALCLLIGGLAGFVIMTVMLAPFFRKFGTFTVPSYLGRRFESRPVRLLAAGLMAVPALLMLAAELRVGAVAGGWLTGQAQGVVILLMVATFVVTAVLGGMRSLTWAGSAEAIAAVLALLVPVTIVAVMVTNFPLPQLTNGPLLRALVHNEAAQGLPIIDAPALQFALPGEGMAHIAKRFTAPFGAIGPMAFVVTILTVLTGVAASPWLIPRVTMTPGVYETRKSLGWATVYFGLIMLTCAAVAVYMRDFVMDIVKAGVPSSLPEWMQRLVDLGFVAIDSAAPLNYMSFAFDRDSVLLSLPVAAGLPAVFLYFAAAGIVAAALVGVSATASAIGNVIAEDVVNGFSWEPLPRDGRLHVARIAMAGIALAGGAVALLAPTDPLRLLLWSLALAGSTFFPVLVLSIWWKRMNDFGAIAGMASGFSVAVLTILAGEANILGIDGALASILGLPAGALGAVLASIATPQPSRSVLELVREIRIPGGEVIYDREMRLLRLKSRERSS